MPNLNEIPFECTRPITCYFIHPTKGVQSTEFIPNTVNRKPAELVGALLAQVDSYGVSPLERYIDAGIVRYLDDGTANGKVEGKIPIIRPPLPAPLQAAAKEYADAQEKLGKITQDKSEIEERARQLAIDAGKRAGRAVVQTPTPRNRGLEHGKAVDVDELASSVAAQVTGAKV